MSRGGRGGGRGGRRMGPDMSWQDEDPDVSTTPFKRVPAPLFPMRVLPTPRPLTSTEKSHVQSLLQIRERLRTGPIYTVIEPSSFLDDRGKNNPRAGFDPFNDQERWTRRYHRPRRLVPDLSEREGYTLTLFPVELWPVLDPKRRQKEYWDTLSEEVKARLNGKNGSSRRKHGGPDTEDTAPAGQKGTKRKRTKLQIDDMIDQAIDPNNNSDSAAGASDDDDDDEDAILNPNRRRGRLNRKDRANKAKTTSSTAAREKQGLDAEDDYPDVDQDDSDNENRNKRKSGADADATAAGDGGAEADEEAGEEEPQDSEFGSDDEDGEDDYNAENYFDAGDDDDFGDDGGDDDGGGGGGGGGGDVY